MRCDLVVHADGFLDLEIDGTRASRHKAAIGIAVVLSKMDALMKFKKGCRCLHAVKIEALRSKAKNQINKSLH